MPWANNHLFLKDFKHPLLQDWVVRPGEDRKYVELEFTVDGKRQMIYELKNGPLVEELRDRLAPLCGVPVEQVYLAVVDEDTATAL